MENLEFLLKMQMLSKKLRKSLRQIISLQRNTLYDNNCLIFITKGDKFIKYFYYYYSVLLSIIKY